MFEKVVFFDDLAINAALADVETRHSLERMAAWQASPYNRTLAVTADVASCTPNHLKVQLAESGVESIFGWLDNHDLITSHPLPDAKERSNMAKLRDWHQCPNLIREKNIKNISKTLEHRGHHEFSHRVLSTMLLATGRRPVKDLLQKVTSLIKQGSGNGGNDGNGDGSRNNDNGGNGGADAFRAALRFEVHASLREGHFKWVHVCKGEEELHEPEGRLKGYRDRTRAQKRDCKWIPSPSMMDNNEYKNPAQYYVKASAPMICRLNHNKDDAGVCSIPTMLGWHGKEGDDEDTSIWSLKRHTSDKRKVKSKFDGMSRERCAFIDGTTVSGFSPQTTELYGKPLATPYDLYGRLSTVLYPRRDQALLSFFFFW